MTPIRADSAFVEPVTLAEMRGVLRHDPDDGGAEDPLVERLIAAARAHPDPRAAPIMGDRANGPVTPEDDARAAVALFNEAMGRAPAIPLGTAAWSDIRSQT